jgi:hypothetical protein
MGPNCVTKIVLTRHDAGVCSSRLRGSVALSWEPLKLLCSCVKICTEMVELDTGAMIILFFFDNIKNLAVWKTENTSVRDPPC